MRALFALALAAAPLACDSSEGSGGDGSTSADGAVTGGHDLSVPDGAKPAPDAAQPGIGLSAKYPGDVGIDQDPAVVFVENFEEGSVAAVTARYESHQNPPGMTLVPGVPQTSRGKAAMQLLAGGGNDATDLYKKLDKGYEELYVRYYEKLEAGVPWHHTGAWVGGYNPATNYPNPQAGLKPNGDDRFSISLEPIDSTAGDSNPHLDFYNYWMTMHSWMDVPMGTTAYYGNALIHQDALRTDDGNWRCIELHIKLNPDPASPAGAELGLFIDDQSIVQFNDQSPVGYWIKDKFCPMGADAHSCTDYPPPPNTPMIPLDLQLRNSAQLQLNYFWPQNYITDAQTGSVYYDDIVIATTRIGCIR